MLHISHEKELLWITNLDKGIEVEKNLNWMMFFCLFHLYDLDRFFFTDIIIIFKKKFKTSTGTLIHRMESKQKVKCTSQRHKGSGQRKWPVQESVSPCSTAHTWPCTYKWIFRVRILSSTFGLKTNETSLSGKITAQPISVSCNCGRISLSLQCEALTMTTTKSAPRKPS